MRSHPRAAAAALLAAILSPAPAVAQDAGAAQLETSNRLRRVQQAAIVYAQRNKGRLPPDLAATLDVLLDPARPDLHGTIRETFLSPADADARIPADATPDWVNEHSSFAYVPAAAGLEWGDIPDWNTGVVVYQRLDNPFPSDPTPENPEGGMVCVGFIDTHTEFCTRAQARAYIENSRRTYDAVRTGADFPDHVQCNWDFTRLVLAVRNYAKAHEDHLPATLGDTLPFLPDDPKRLATGAQRARLYLSPRAKKETQIPDEPTPDWINQHTSYLYPGSADILLSEIDDPRRLLVLYARPVDALKVGPRRERSSPSAPSAATPRRRTPGTPTR